MESFISEFIMWQLAYEQLPTCHPPHAPPCNNRARSLAFPPIHLHNPPNTGRATSTAWAFISRLFAQPETKTALSSAADLNYVVAGGGAAAAPAGGGASGFGGADVFVDEASCSPIFCPDEVRGRKKEKPTAP